MRFGALALLIAPALAGCGGPAGDACARYTAPPSANGAPAADPSATGGQAYVDAVAAGDLYEIEAALLALEKAADRDVRALARMILADHRSSTELLTRAAGEAAPPLRLDPRLTPAQNRDLAALCRARPDAFDGAYLRQRIAAHERALALVELYTREGRVASLRAHAAWVPATLGRHIAWAREQVAARDD